MRKFVFLLIDLIIISTNLFSQAVITSIGKGADEVQARQNALSEMSYIFCSRVQASSESRESYQEEQKKSKAKTRSIKEIDLRVLVTSDMPLLGVTFKTDDNGNKRDPERFTVKASLSAAKAVPFYEKEIFNIVEKINQRQKGLKKLSGDKLESEWQSLSGDYALLDKYEFVCSVLGVENKIKPEVSSADFRIKYEQRAKQLTTIEKASDAIVKAICSQEKNKNRIYVYPALFEGENSSTDFSVALANGVKTSLSKKAVLSRGLSDSYLKGSYYFAPGSAEGDDLVVNYYLCSEDGSILASSGLIKIPYSTYSQYKYVPRSYDLQKEIASGRVSDPEFDVSIRINGERNSLEFEKGKPLVIEVRTTKACYIYVTGHVYNDEGAPLSYLFPMDMNGDGKEIFVRKISAKEAGSWVVINPVVDGEVLSLEVIEPFGEETLQVYASTTSDFDTFVSRIPSYIETDDYYLVSGSPVENVSKTRALNIKRVADRASQVENVAEGFVTYMTHE